MAGTLYLYGVIGEAADKLDARTVTSAIRASSGPLAVRINSAGGYVMEGLAIVEAIRSYPGKVTAYIDGLAASMASVIASAAAEVVMAESALWMAHNPWDSATGDAAELRAHADRLDTIKGQIVGIYAKRSGLPDADVAVMMNAEPGSHRRRRWPPASSPRSPRRSRLPPWPTSRPSASDTPPIN